MSALSVVRVGRIDSPDVPYIVTLNFTTAAKPVTFYAAASELVALRAALAHMLDDASMRFKVQVVEVST